MRVIRMYAIRSLRATIIPTWNIIFPHHNHKDKDDPIYVYDKIISLYTR